MHKSLESTAKKIMKWLDDLFFPYVGCIACSSEEALDENHLCDKCAKILSEKKIRETRMGDITVLSPYLYSGPAGALVRNLKFRRDGACIKPLADGLVYAFVNRDLRGKCDFIVPVPISKKRYQKRGFNQSELIANELGRIIGVPVRSKCIERIRHTKEQSKLKGRARRRNVMGAFKARDVDGAAILLVDDVYTTGATTYECTKALLEAGAKDVIVLCATISKEYQNMKSEQTV